MSESHALEPYFTTTALQWIADGPYVLNLQVAPFMIDAAPSRPILLPLLPT
jgi:hypothetical protein